MSGCEAYLYVQARVWAIAPFGLASNALLKGWKAHSRHGPKAGLPLAALGGVFATKCDAACALFRATSSGRLV